MRPRARGELEADPSEAAESPRKDVTFQHQETQSKAREENKRCIRRETSSTAIVASGCALAGRGRNGDAIRTAYTRREKKFYSSFTSASSLAE
ncbi:hypothetical protein EVAR_26574_1 [Eumeta japonica]|uniref:Uncharacterized protein n=1 Tax=Eumeta variegata TaxID=151549 RepID=A0A4C1W6G9_EUMVA|nr:hypothetical protein EVAR_26574_1 [Eumeta japonica]